MRATTVVSHTLCMIYSPCTALWSIRTTSAGWNPAMALGPTFTVQSIYKMTNNPRVVQVELRDIWSLKILNKIKIFLRLLLQNRLNTSENLRSKGWPSNQICILCLPLLLRHNYTYSINANSHLVCYTDKWEGHFKFNNRYLYLGYVPTTPTNSDFGRPPYEKYGRKGTHTSFEVSVGSHIGCKIWFKIILANGCRHMTIRI
jgi:zinc-binding in reverse transcriptase